MIYTYMYHFWLNYQCFYKQWYDRAISIYQRVFKIKGAKNDVWRGSIITAKIKNSSKKAAKTSMITLKIHDRNRERLYMSR